MARSGTSDEAIPSRQKEAIATYNEVLSANVPRIKDIFDSVLAQEAPPEKIGPLGDRLTWIFEQEEIEGEDQEELINSVLNTSINYGTDVRRELEDLEIDDAVIGAFEYISINHAAELERQANRRTKGDDWWNNLSTTISSKNGAVLLTHEFTIDMKRKVNVSNNIQGNHILANHVLNQTMSARNIIGEDALENVNEEILEDMKETIDDILEEKQLLEEQKETDEEDSD